MHTRWGLDIGSTSLGWVVMQNGTNGEPKKILASGVRIFSDGREAQGQKESLAVSRRIARGARRRRDRLLDRKARMKAALIDCSLFPQDEGARQSLKDLEPYAIRAKAVTETVSPHELGRALFHLIQRRGYNESRKGDKKEAGVIKPKMDALSNLLREKGWTLGQFLNEQKKEGRIRFFKGSEYYPQREHYLAEFEKIKDTQKPHHKLSDSDWAHLKDIIFFQRDLKPQELGQCQLYQEEKRTYKALPTFQRFRIWQIILTLKFVSTDRKIKIAPSLEQMKTLAAALEKQQGMAFSKIRKLLKVSDDFEFNIEDEKRTKLEGNKTTALLSKKEYFGNRWFDFTQEKQDDIVLTLLHEGNPKTLREKATSEWGCTVEEAESLVNLEDQKLESGTARFSLRGLRDILAKMSQQGLSVTEAVRELRGNIGHNRQDDLEYYGKALPDRVMPATKAGDPLERQWGKINNPSVHIAMNQLRHVGQELLERYGRPEKIVIELSRDLKLTKDAKADLHKFQTKRDKENERIRKLIVSENLRPNEDAVTTNDILLVKLWEELDPKDSNNRKCPYTGQTISIKALFTGEFEIEHILPISRTGDDSYRNMTISAVSANRFKGNNSPYEAFTRSNSKWPYDEIVERVQPLPKNKRWRFMADAMEKFEAQEGGFAARQLTDTQYMSKLARLYLQTLYDPEEGDRVLAIHGQLTAKIRHQWGLNSLLAPATQDEEEQAKKNRNNLKHHAIDAAVIACTDHALIKRAADASGKGLADSLRFDPPWENFRADLAEAIGNIVVSHRPDHGKNNALHAETVFGIIPENRMTDYERENGYNVVVRKEFLPLFKEQAKNIEPEKALKLCKRIRDKHLREQLTGLLERAMTGDDVASITEAFTKQHGLRSIRMLDKQATVRAITHTQNGEERTKGLLPDGNHHIAFWRLPDGTMQWQGVSYFDLAQSKNDLNKLKPHREAKLITRISNSDIVRAKQDGVEKTFRVKSLKVVARQIEMVEVHETGDFAKRIKEKEVKPLLQTISLAKLQETSFRKIFVSPTGKIYDNGPMFKDVSDR